MRRLSAIGFFLLLISPCFAQQKMIYDDDCTQDVDCVLTLPLLFALEAHGEIRIVAMVADSDNPLAAPAMKVFAAHARRPQPLIGANQQDTPDTALCAKFRCNESAWLPGLIAWYDTRTNFKDCVTVYREALAGQPDHSVSIVATGFATRLTQLLESPPDTISASDGAALVRSSSP
jgi:hypothetical protein